MSERVIWDKLPEGILENFEIARVKPSLISKFSNITRVIYPQNCPNQTNKHFVFKLVCFNSGQLQISERAIAKQRAIKK